MDHRVQVDCESLLGVGRDSLLVSMRGPTTPRARMTHADAHSTGGMCDVVPSAHIHPAGSVAVLINLDTTPVQLRTTLIQTADPTGARNSSYLVVPACGYPIGPTPVIPLGQRIKILSDL